MLVAGATQPVLRAEMVNDQTSGDTGIGGDGTQPDTAPVPSEPGDGGVTDPSQVGELTVG
jgi:hypothetical protein